VPRASRHARHREALDEHARLVVRRERHRPGHRAAALAGEPRAGRVHQERSSLGVVLHREEAEAAVHAGRVRCDVRGDPPDGLSPATQEEVRGVAAVEERVAMGVEPPALVAQQQWRPLGLAVVKRVRQLDEPPQRGLARDLLDLEHRAASHRRTI
jgi:hypothetical protein